jgi:hypothetical protein
MVISGCILRILSRNEVPAYDVKKQDMVKIIKLSCHVGKIRSIPLTCLWPPDDGKVQIFGGIEA